jgi:hypothetical protein
MADGQSAGQSSYEAHSVAQDQILLLSVVVLSMWGTLSDERTVLPFSVILSAANVNNSFQLFVYFCMRIVFRCLAMGYVSVIMSQFV